MKVYCDAIEWYPFFELDERHDPDAIELEITPSEWAAYKATMELFEIWQQRLRDAIDERYPVKKRYGRWVPPP